MCVRATKNGCNWTKRYYVQVYEWKVLTMSRTVRFHCCIVSLTQFSDVGSHSNVRRTEWLSWCVCVQCTYPWMWIAQKWGIHLWKMAMRATECKCTWAYIYMRSLADVGNSEKPSFESKTWITSTQSDRDGNTEESRAQQQPNPFLEITGKLCTHMHQHNVDRRTITTIESQTMPYPNYLY